MNRPTQPSDRACIDTVEKKINLIRATSQNSGRVMGAVLLGPTISFAEALKHTQTDWSQVTSRDPLLTDAEYQARLVDVMRNPVLYRQRFEEPFDMMALGSDGRMINGRHRALAGLIMGTQVVEQLSWIRVKVHRVSNLAREIS